MRAPRSKSPEEAVETFLRKRLEQSGYSVQSTVRKVLATAGFASRREVPYLDKDEGKGRSIDLVANTFIPDENQFRPRTRYAVGSLSLIIECKSLPGNAWVFFESKPDFPGEIPQTVTISESLSPDPALQFIPFLEVIPELALAEGYAEFVVNPSQSNKSDKNLYGSFLAAVKATRHLIDSSRELVNKINAALPPRTRNTRLILFTIFQPLVIFQGMMYLASHETGEISPAPIVRLPCEYVSERYNETTGGVHIVSFNSLQTYLDLLRKHYWARSDRLVKSQDLILQTLDAI